MRHLITSLLLLSLSVIAGAQIPGPVDPDVWNEVQQGMAAELEDVVITDEPDEPFVPAYLIEQSAPKKPGSSVHFAWGANVGAAIDMSGNDMSAIELSLAVGMRWKGLKFLGLGVQSEVMVSNSRRSYPIYVQVRTNFRDDPSLFFWDIRGGLSINYLEDNLKQTGAYFSTGLGIVLAHSARFSSHMILGYEFHSRTDIDTEERLYSFPNLHAVVVKLGVAF